MSKNKEPSATYKAILENDFSEAALKMRATIPAHTNSVKRIAIGTVRTGTFGLVEVYKDGNKFFVRAIANTVDGLLPYTLDSHGPYKRFNKAHKRAMAVAERVVLNAYPHPRYWICH